MAKDFKLASVNLGHSATWRQRRPRELVQRACQLTSVSRLLPEARENQRESFYYCDMHVETCAEQENLTLESESIEAGVLSDGLQRGIRKMRDAQQRNGRQGGTSINQSLWGQSMRVTCSQAFSLKTQLQPHQNASVWQRGHVVDNNLSEQATTSRNGHEPVYSHLGQGREKTHVWRSYPPGAVLFITHCFSTP